MCSVRDIIIGLLVLSLTGGAVGCYGEVPSAPATSTVDVVADVAVAPEVEPLVELPEPPLEEVVSSAVMRRLTDSQYRNTLYDWFGEALVLPSTLEPDQRSEGLYAVGASLNGLSTLGVERYVSGAKSMASQFVTYAPLRAALLAECDDPDAEACLETLVDTWAPRLWRRPVTAAERERLLAVADGAVESLGSIDEGIRYAMMAILASPHFLYITGFGDAASDGVRPYTAWEMASRLSFFLWNAGPDAEMLATAESGELLDPVRFEEIVDAMLADPRARRGIRAFAEDWLELDVLTTLSKDPEAYLYFSPDLGQQAREETLSLFEHLVFEAEADFRTLMTTRTTFVNTRLAALYGVPSPSFEGFAELTLPEDGPRAGLLGHASVLALHASPNRSSPTLRGLFVRERLLCQHMPSPPANVDTTIPESSADAPTMRERLEVHLETPSCAGCHALTDPIGLGLERFDGLGGFRAMENDVPIDPSGELDGASFDDARELGQVLADHPAFVPCVVDTLWAYANGQVGHSGEQTDVLVAGFQAKGYRLLELLRAIALSEAFRHVGPDDETEGP